MSLILKIYKKFHPVPPSPSYLCYSCLHLLSTLAVSILFSYLVLSESSWHHHFIETLIMVTKNPHILKPMAIFNLHPTSYLDTFFLYLPHAILTWSLLDFSAAFESGFLNLSTSFTLCHCFPLAATLTTPASPQFLKATMFPPSQGFAHTTHPPNIPHPILLS